MNQNNIKIGFFGTSEYAVTVLDYLKKVGHTIAFIVTTPDKPKGRKLIVTASPVKVWATEHNIPILQPENLKNNPVFEDQLRTYKCDVFIVIAYGKIIPDSILLIPPRKSLNIHGSILPELRGSCPIETAILQDKKNTGVSIIRMDNLMDHGPILASKEVIVEPWPPTVEVLGKAIVKTGAELLTEILPAWIDGSLPEKEQDHSRATITKKIQKEDGLINLSDDPHLNFRKIQAYHEWPQAYFMIKHKGKDMRIKITSASFKDEELIIEKVIPEGGKEMSYKDFQSGYLQK